jgi:hypothetical protein
MSEQPDFDVVLVGGATEDGEGARVLRARPGQLEQGEVRPVREGKPLVPGAEVVSLEKRGEHPALYDVKTVHKQEGTLSGPAQVATKQYRDSWERTFGRKTEALN